LKREQKKTLAIFKPKENATMQAKKTKNDKKKGEQAISF